MISSVIPSLKYSFSGSALMLASGSTAMDFAAAAAPTGVRAPAGSRSRCSACSSASANSRGRREAVHRGPGQRAVTIAWSTASGTSRIARTCGTGETNRLAMIGLRGGAGERRLAGQHLVQHAAQAVEVAPAVDRPARRTACSGLM